MTGTLQLIHDLRERNASADPPSRIVGWLLEDALLAADAGRADEANKLANIAEHEQIVHEIKQTYGVKSRD